MELLNKVSLYYGTIIVYFQSANGFLYYSSSIGPVVNLSVGDIMYTNQALTSFPTAGTYTQIGDDSATTHCSNGSNMVMVIGTNGVITAISCQIP